MDCAPSITMLLGKVLMPSICLTCHRPFSSKVNRSTSTVTPRPDCDALELYNSRACSSVKMSAETLPICWPPGNSDFVDVSDVFLDAAEGMSLT